MHSALLARTRPPSLPITSSPLCLLTRQSFRSSPIYILAQQNFQNVPLPSNLRPLTSPWTCKATMRMRNQGRRRRGRAAKVKVTRQERAVSKGVRPPVLLFMSPWGLLHHVGRASSLGGSASPAASSRRILGRTRERPGSRRFTRCSELATSPSCCFTYLLIGGRTRW